MDKREKKSTHLKASSTIEEEFRSIRGFYQRQMWWLRVWCTAYIQLIYSLQVRLLYAEYFSLIRHSNLSTSACVIIPVMINATPCYQYFFPSVTSKFTCLRLRFSKRHCSQVYTSIVSQLQMLGVMIGNEKNPRCWLRRRGKKTICLRLSSMWYQSSESNDVGLVSAC